MNNRSDYQTLTLADRIFNRCFGLLVRIGLGPRYAYQLENRGRQTGRLYATPVFLHRFEGQNFLVAPRGHTQWVRNVRASSRVTLRQGKNRQLYNANEVPANQRAAILRNYLKTYQTSVNSYFSLEPDAPDSAFEAIAADHPVFALTTLAH